MIREGGCLCGAVRFRGEGEPINVRTCHCRNCQKAMGTFFARALFAQSALTIEGDTARFASSESLDRVFCTTCGTRLFALAQAYGTMASIALAAFDDRNAFAPTEHIWVSEHDGLGQARRRLAAISARAARLDHPDHDPIQGHGQSVCSA